jgi:hypothetical protein
MAVNLRRLKPIPTAVAAVVGVLWAISFGAVRDFVWGDLRHGMMDLRGLSRLTRSIVLFGFSLLFGMLVVLLMNDFLRDQFSLIAMPNSSIFAPGRGIMLPVPLVPLTLFLIAIAWSFILAGALHSHLIIRLAVLAFYLLTAIRQLESLLVSILTGSLSVNALIMLVFTILSILAVIVFFLIMGWARPKPALEFSVLLFLVSLTFFLTQIRNVFDFRQTGIPLGLANLQMDVVDFSMIAIPFLLYLGVDIADFTLQISGWVTKSLSLHLPTWAAIGGFFLFSGWRIYGLAVETLSQLAQSTLKVEMLGFLGAFGEILLVGVVWFFVNRLVPADKKKDSDSEILVETLAPKVLWVILIYNFTSLINFSITSVAAAFPFPAFANPIIRLSTFLNNSSEIWGLVVNCAAVVAAIWLARKGKKALASYLGIFGLVHLYYKFTNPGEILGRLTWNGPQKVDTWWVVVFTVMGIYLLFPKKIHRENFVFLSSLVLITFLLRQTAFISNPLSPVFGFAGVGFIAFGVLWDALTSGSWANISTPGLSRTTRIFLYLGYVILTVTVINWALTTHDLSSLNQLTGDTALVGLDRFGRPLLYVFFATTAVKIFTAPISPEMTIPGE